MDEANMTLQDFIEYANVYRREGDTKCFMEHIVYHVLLKKVFAGLLWTIGSRISKGTKFTQRH